MSEQIEAPTSESESNIDTEIQFGETDPETASADDLIALDYNGSIENISALDSYLDNLSDAAAFMQRVVSAIDDLKSNTGVSELSEIGEEVDENYIELGDVLISQLDDVEVLFADSDEPEMLVSDIEKFAKALENEYDRQQKLAEKKSELNGYEDSLKSHSGSNAAEAIEEYEQRITQLEEARHLLQLKDGECDRCGVKWEIISEERRTEIVERLDELEEALTEAGGSLTEEYVDNQIEETKTQLETAENLKKDLKRVRKDIKRLQDQGTEDLDQLVAKRMGD